MQLYSNRKTEHKMRLQICFGDNILKSGIRDSELFGFTGVHLFPRGLTFLIPRGLSSLPGIVNILLITLADF